jgi:hypothetical protein
MTRWHRALLLVVVATLSCRTASNPGGVPADATLELRATSLAAGVGYSWGKGTLTFQGQSYPVDIDGLSVGAVGLSVVTAHGGVYALTNLTDFDGNYLPVKGGSGVGSGGASIVMRNPYGVEIRLLADTTGITLTIGPAGVNLKVERSG